MTSRSENPTGGGALNHALTDVEGVLEAVPDAMVAVGRSGVIRFVNHRAEALFGYDRDDLVGQLIETLVPESFRTVHQAQREGYVADPRTREMGVRPELTGRRRDGTEFPIDIGLACLGSGEDIVVIASVRDMTARHRAEQDRREADRLAALVEFSGDAIVSSTLDGVVTSWNPAAERLFGYPKDEIVGRSITVLSPSEGTCESGLVMAKVRAGHSVENLETERLRKDGTVFPVSLTVSPICDDDGVVTGISAIPRDITVPKQAAAVAQRLSVAEDLVHGMMGSTPLGVSLADLDGYIRVVNQALIDLLGYDEAWFLTHRVDDLVHPDNGKASIRRRAVSPGPAPRRGPREPSSPAGRSDECAGGEAASRAGQRCHCLGASDHGADTRRRRPAEPPPRPVRGRHRRARGCGVTGVPGGP
jgi:PAS domain S-box-containing protein